MLPNFWRSNLSGLESRTHLSFVEMTLKNWPNLLCLLALPPKTSITNLISNSRFNGYRTVGRSKNPDGSRVNTMNSGTVEFPNYDKKCQRFWTRDQSKHDQWRAWVALPIDAFYTSYLPPWFGASNPTKVTHLVDEQSQKNWKVSKQPWIASMNTALLSQPYQIFEKPRVLLFCSYGIRHALVPCRSPGAHAKDQVLSTSMTFIAFLAKRWWSCWDIFGVYWTICCC